MTTLLVERNVPVPMRDGTRLCADIWRPAAADRYPVLLQRTPYDKRLWLLAQAPLDPARAVEAGYAVLIQDVRGRFASQGTFEPFRQELCDGVDTVRWAATRPWSDGWVGSYGASYVGATQMLAATAGAPLKAMALGVTASEYYEGWTYQGGALQLGFVLNWVYGLAAGELERREAKGGEQPELRRLLDEALADPWALYWRLPLADQPALSALAPYFDAWLAHPSRDRFWLDTAVGESYADHRLPALHIGGWNDIFASGTLRNFRGLRAAGARGQRLLVGPWAHGTMGEMLGDVSYGPSASRWLLDSTDLHLDYFHRIRADEAEADDGRPVRVFAMGENRWHDELDWPPPDVAERRLFLRSSGRLSWEPPGTDEDASQFTHDPHDPVPTVGGQTLLPGHEISIMLGAREQSAIEGRPDVLVFTTETLTKPLAVAGQVSVILHAASTAVDTDWTAKLVDVDPGDRAVGIVDGILRARYRNGFDRPELLEPGRPYEYAIEVGDTYFVFLPGHRIRLQLASSNFPRFDRNPGTGDQPATAPRSSFRVARQTVFHDANRASVLCLQVRQP